MRTFLLGILIIVIGLVSCQPEAATLTPTVQPSRQPATVSPTQTSTLSSVPTSTSSPTFTPTLKPTRTPRPTDTQTPTATPLPSPISFPIQPANPQGQWTLYNSANSIDALFFDGTFIWAGAVDGGLTQWDPHSLISIRHTRATGFPLNTVYDLDYDEQSGYLYAVGDLGLAIWDGKSWLHRTQKHLGFAPDLPLTAVLADEGTMIWVGAEERTDYDWALDEIITSDGGLAYGNWISGPWSHFDVLNAPSSNQINDLLLDDHGNLWVACGLDSSTGSGGVSMLGTDRNWTHYYSTRYEKPGDLEGYWYHSLALGHDGTIYAGGDHLSYLFPNTAEWISRNISGYLYQIAIDLQGNLWYPYCGDNECFALYGTGDNSWKTEENFPYWSAITFDAEGDFWLANTNGLFEKVDDAIQPRVVADSLPNNWVEQVAVNGDDSVWFTTTRSDAYREDKRYISCLAERKITNFWSERQAVEAAYPWTGSDSLWSVDPDGMIWLKESVTNDYGSITGYQVSGYDGKTWHTLPKIFNYGQVSQPMVSDNGTIAVISDAGLSLYILGEGWQEPTWPWDGDAYFGSLLFDREGDIWITQSYGFFMASEKILRYSPDTKEWDTFSSIDTGIGYVPPNGINLSPTGELWVVGLFGDGRVGVYQGDGTWKTTDLGYFHSWAEVYFEIDGSPWFTTVVNCGFESYCIDGLLYIDGSRTVHQTVENSGLINGRVNDLSFDSNGNVWLATGAGLQMMPKP